MNRYVCNACGIYSRIHKTNRPYGRNSGEPDNLGKRKVDGKDKDGDNSKSQKLNDSRPSGTSNTQSSSSQSSIYRHSLTPSNRSMPTGPLKLQIAVEHSRLRYENLSNPELHTFTQLRSLAHVSKSDHPRYSATKEYSKLAPLRIPRGVPPSPRLQDDRISTSSAESGRITAEFSGLSVLASEAVSATIKLKSDSHPMSLKSFLS